jgi:hypothetical protein
VTPVPAFPSPYVQEYEAIAPSGSYDADAFMDTATPGCVVDAESVNEATGGWFEGAETTAERVVEAVAPLLSWTVRVAV